MKSGLLNIDRQQWVVLLLLGLLLAVAALPVSHERQTKKTVAEEGTAEKTELEKKLEQFLSHVEGVGKTEVVLMTEEGGSFGNEETIKVTGALVSAEGGENPATVQKIQDAVQALFQIEAHKIKIMK
ncbi:MAG: stage III sporulation protein AG, partial [Eubacteriales bacterium]|nr:stage III sporulation protein AG [Eubacteriales bacterium]